MDLYLRPETAQGFCKLLKCAKSGRVPFGIAQTGKHLEMKYETIYLSYA
jgi:glycyl-tRNA synthetase (class II)